MSDELFEVAFSGQIIDGADLAQVKEKVGAMFKADETKLVHLFSGKRVVIKKNIDQKTANKYKTALQNAGAVCEIKSLSENVSAVVPKIIKAEEKAPQKNEQEKPKKVLSGDIPAAPQTAPLHIQAGDITELSADLAPIGSEMQDGLTKIAEPEFDMSELDVAPAGSDLGQTKKEDDPPPPNTDGMTMAE